MKKLLSMLIISAGALHSISGDTPSHMGISQEPEYQSAKKVPTSYFYLKIQNKHNQMIILENDTIKQVVKQVVNPQTESTESMHLNLNSGEIVKITHTKNANRPYITTPETLYSNYSNYLSENTLLLSYNYDHIRKRNIITPLIQHTPKTESYPSYVTNPVKPKKYNIPRKRNPIQAM